MELKVEGRAADILNENAFVRLLAEAVGESYRLYGWLKLMIQQQAGDEETTTNILSAALQRVSKDGTLLPFDDSTLVRGLRFTMIPLLEAQIKVNNDQGVMYSQLLKATKDTFLSQPLPFANDEFTKIFEGYNAKSAWIFVGDPADIRELFLNFSAYYASQKLKAVYLVGKLSEGEQFKDIQVPKIERGKCAHFLGFTGMFETMRKICDGSDVILVEDFISAISKRDEETKPITGEAFAAGLRRAIRWARDRRFFFVTSMTVAEANTYLPDRDAKDCDLIRINVTRVDGKLSVAGNLLDNTR